MFSRVKNFNMYFALLVILVLGIIMYFATIGYMGMFFATIIIFTIFKPFYKWLVLTKNMNRTGATWLTLFVSIISLVLPFITAVLVMGNGIAAFINNNSEAIQNLVIKMPQYLTFNNDLYQKEIFQGVTLQKAFENINFNYGALAGMVSGFLQNTITTITSGISSFFLQLIVMYFVLYFLFKDWDKFAAAFYHYSPYNTKNTQKLIKQFTNITYANIVGSALVAVAQGIAVWLGFKLFGLGSSAAFWGFIAAIMSFIPIVGVPLVWVPAVIILMIQGQWFNGVALLIWCGTLVSWLDSLLRPFVTKHVGDIHPLISIIGIFIGIPMFGFWGIIVGPALLSFFLISIEMFYEEFLDKPSPKSAASIKHHTK